MRSLLQQVKTRRLGKGLKQHDMMLRVGMSRQQYQRLESKGNPRLDTLELIAKGLNSELLLIPQEKLNDVLAVLSDTAPSEQQASEYSSVSTPNKPINEEPWQDLLQDDQS